MKKQNVQLLAWKFSVKNYLQKEYQKSLLSLLAVPEGQGQFFHHKLT